METAYDPLDLQDLDEGDYVEFWTWDSGRGGSAGLWLNGLVTSIDDSNPKRNELGLSPVIKILGPSGKIYRKPAQLRYVKVLRKRSW